MTAILKVRTPAPGAEHQFWPKEADLPLELITPEWLARYRIQIANAETGAEDLDSLIKPVEEEPKTQEATELELAALMVEIESAEANSQLTPQSGQAESSGTPPNDASTAEGLNPAPQPGHAQEENSRDVSEMNMDESNNNTVSEKDKDHE